MREGASPPGAPRPGRRDRPIPADSPGIDVATYLRRLRSDAAVTYRQMAETVPCRHNTLSQTVDGRLTGWEPIRTFIKAIRDAAGPDKVPADAEERARALWTQARLRKGSPVVPAGPEPEPPVDPPAPELPQIPEQRPGGKLSSFMQRVAKVIRPR